MLKLNNITKTYITGSLKQDALKGVSLAFRDNEFVSILGHSGSGKTTLLNIIGGLDHYTDGDLLINGVSTKKYKDKDWDSYRNHDIGFVFQSYNLIPHQTVLANVELALTLSGVSSKERQQRATEALEKVGLKDHIHKRPNQLSGGQMQRVAIARALVNDPKIVLADEPTGALDSETSIQIMNLLKEISKDRLVIMVTHNPELAYQYSTRIIKLSDGKIIDDSLPYNGEDENKTDDTKRKKTSMSFLTALSLSLNNLLTKKLRTFMTSFAGSIGIMGIALILSVSTGFQKYIDHIEESTLTSYPLSIYSETADASSAILSMVSEATSSSDESKDKGEVVEEKAYISKMFESIGKNDLKSFKAYLEDEQETVDELCSSVVYKYSISPRIYTTDVTGSIVRVNPSSISVSGYSSSVFSEMISDYELLEDSYDVLAGRWPEAYDELVIVLSEPNSISDLLAYSIGLKDTSQLKEMMVKAMNGESITEEETTTWTYEDLLNLKFKLVDPTSYFKYNEKYDVYEDMRDDSEFMRTVYEESVDLKVVGVVCLNSSSSSMALSPGVNYTSDLTKYVLEKASESEIVKKQLEDETIDVFSGQPFEEESESELDFNDMISIDTNALNSAFGLNDDLSNIDPDAISALVDKYSKKLSEGVVTDTSIAYNDLQQLLIDLCDKAYVGYCKYTLEDDLVTFSSETVERYAEQFMVSDEFIEMVKNVNDAYSCQQDMITEEYQKLVRSFLITTVENLNFTSSVSYDVALSYKDSSIDLFAATITSDENEKVTFDSFALYLTTCKLGKTVENNSADLSKEFTSDIVNMFGKDLITVDADKIASAFSFNMTQDDLTRLMESMMNSSSSATAQSNLRLLCYQNEDEPTSISFYFKDFAGKQKLKDFIDDYNKKQTDEDKQITYTDVTGLLMSSVETIVNAVTYVLIAFVSISLVVSTIMIGVITLISVMERTKEIGILRAIGASKRDVANVFNAETFIIGALSGIIGIVGSKLLLIPINKILYHLTGIEQLKAVLPNQSSAILIAISIVLTLLSGLIPARSASKKDPVEALRTE